MNFLGQVSSSKSLLNRALIVQSFFPDLEIEGYSPADDVVKMQSALSRIHNEKDFDCGEAGTTLRFLALRLSREVGRFRLFGSERLFERPQSELKSVLEQLGVSVELKKSEMILESKGWRVSGDTLIVPSSRSSQFVSAVALSGWKLPFDLFVSPEGLVASEAYFRMTTRFLESLGMVFQFWDKDFKIAKGQSIDLDRVVIEPDMSSAFSLAAVAAVSGSADFVGFPVASLQPDFNFISILKAMGVPVTVQANGLHIGRTQNLKGISVDLKNTPDLFPVLASLCALASSPSELTGTSQLAFKESHRLNKMKELLEFVGCEVKGLSDGISITPPPHPKSGFAFDTDRDHRLAMACGVLIKAGVSIEVINPDVVAKSFPDYWECIGVSF